jgi:hypothetical protein
MNAFTNKKGFTVIRNTDTDAMKINGKETFRENGVYAYVSVIPYCERTSTIVHFVSGTNGDEFGQFPTSAMAKEKAREMAKLTESERAAFDA